MEARNGPTISASECRADADSLVDSLTRALRTSPFVDTSELYTWKGGERCFRFVQQIETFDLITAPEKRHQRLAVRLRG